jgi:hypothetical protein
VKAKFIEPMLLLRTSKLPEGGAWSSEIKWDGYRAVSFKTGGRVQLALPQRQGLFDPLSAWQGARGYSRFFRS